MKQLIGYYSSKSRTVGQQEAVWEEAVERNGCNRVQTNVPMRPENANLAVGKTARQAPGWLLSLLGGKTAEG